RAIATLEAKTLIERSADPKDRRISRITLTGEGRNIFEKVVAIALRFEERLLAGLSEHERRLFLELFDRVEAQAAREFQR
ncbi:MAG: MarR family transcriptional regulator, partial [Pseudomonadota bacterium]